MVNQIVKQPNGKYCLFSSIVDNVIHYNLTKDDIIKIFTEESIQEIEERVSKIINKLESKGKPYYQFTESFNDLIQTIKEVHGEDEANKIKSMTES